LSRDYEGITIVNDEESEWTGVYLAGTIVSQDHSWNIDTNILDILQIDYSVFRSQPLEDTVFPDNLVDVEEF